MEASTKRAAPVDGAPAGATGPSPRLKSGAISYVSNVVIGVASTAPALSLALTIGFIVGIGGMGAHMPAVIIVSFIPMFFIAMAYRNMNAVDPDCGTAFSWATRAIGPGVGWVVGWATLVAQIVVNASEAQTAGSYAMQLFSANVTLSGTMIIGGVFIIILTFICWKGIELSARTQMLLLMFEVATLVIFAIVALVKVITGDAKHSMTLRFDWFNPLAVSSGTLLGGLLLGVFLYWGWDTGVSVNEESQNSRTAPGKSAMTSNLVLIGLFLLVATAAQAYGGPGYLAKNSTDIFAGGLSRGVLGSLHFLLIIAVLTSATAATQTTILPAARSALSMARRGAIPKRFETIHAKNLTPSTATIWIGVLALIWFLAIEELSTNVLGDCVAGLGFLVCFYYGATGITSAVFFRHELGKSVRNLLVLGLLPVLGAIMLGIVFVKGVMYYGHAANDYSKPLLGLGVPDWIAIVGIGGGVVLMLWRRRVAPGFFTEPRLVAGDPIETVTPEVGFAPAEQLL